MENERSNLATNLRFYRTRKGWSQAGLGAKVGCSQQVIFSYESGGSTPSPERLKRLAIALGVTTDVLLKEQNQPIKSPMRRKTLRRLQLVEKLPPSAQRRVVALIEELADAYGIRK